MSQAVLGIDVSKHKLDAALFLHNKFKHKIFPQSPSGFQQMQAWLLRHEVSELHVCMEATGTFSEDIARFLQEQGYRVSVVNPARISAFAKAQLSRNKTDKLDASLIAQFCLSQKPEPWVAPSPALRELQCLVRHLDNLTDSVQKEKNRHGSGIPSSTVLESIEKLIEGLESEILKTKKKIQELLDQTPNLKNDHDLLITIPGIGSLTASKILAEIPQIKSFTSVKQLVAFAGLNPQQHSSGSSVHRKSRLSKTGSPRIRKLLFMPALVAKTRNPAFKNFETKLLLNGKSKMTAVVAIMRKLLHIAFGVLKSNQHFTQNLAFAP